MKKVTFFLALTSGASLLAAPVGNPAFPQLLKEGYAIPNNCWFDLRLGYEGDFIGDGRMKQYKEGHGRVDNYEQTTNSGTVTLNFFDRLDIFGVFGSSRVSSDWRFEVLDASVNRVELETNYNFLWAVGARGILFEWGNTILGVGGRYNATHLKPVWTCINGNQIPTAGTRLRWKEWQFDLDITHKIEIFIPYIGLKYSNSRTKIGHYLFDISSDGTGTLHMKNRTPVGIVIGCTLTTEKFFMLNVEGRLIDEDALTIVGDFRF